MSMDRSGSGSGWGDVSARGSEGWDPGPPPAHVLEEGADAQRRRANALQWAAEERDARGEGHPFWGVVAALRMSETDWILNELEDLRKANEQGLKGPRWTEAKALMENAVAHRLHADLLMLLAETEDPEDKTDLPERVARKRIEEAEAFRAVLEHVRAEVSRGGS